jgi:hypothetical protein
MPEAREWFLLVDFTGSLKFPNDGGADESKFCIELYAPSGYSGRLVLSFGSCRGVFGSPWAGDAASTYVLYLTRKIPTIAGMRMRARPF